MGKISKQLLWIIFIVSFLIINNHTAVADVCTINVTINSQPAELTDTDCDGYPDACDIEGCPNEISKDNCPFVFNNDQADTDADGVGDACDTDIDNDGYKNDEEIAKGTDPYNPSPPYPYPRVKSVTVTPGTITGDKVPGDLEIKVVFNEPLDIVHLPDIAYTPSGSAYPQPCGGGIWSQTTYPKDTFTVTNTNPIDITVNEGPATINIQSAKNVLGYMMQPNNANSFIIDFAGKIFYVDINSTCQNNCGRIEAPFKNIQQAIDTYYGQSNGDQILVYPGTYSGPISIYNKAITVKSIAGPEATIIQGGGSVVSFMYSEGAVLDGFTITGGTGSSPPGAPSFVKAGGGIKIINAYPTIRNCIITGNGTSVGIGGGVLIWSDSEATISNCIITNNTAQFGGGICAVQSLGIINHCTIADNIGEGINVWEAATIKNTILWNNDLSYYDPSMITVTYSDIEYGDFNGVNGNISVNPLFYGQGDYHLSINSPCIDAGDPTDDYSLEPQPNGGRINMGAYGNTPEAAISTYDCTLDYDEDGFTDCDEINIYGTSPGEADTDKDGINDRDEVNYWGANWNTDTDGDGLKNILDPDSDNDGYRDGEEITAGTNPANSNPTFPYPKLLSVTATPDPTGAQSAGGLQIKLLFNEGMDINFLPVVTYDPAGAVGLQPCSNGSWLSTNFSNDTYVIANENPITPYVGQGPATIQVNGARNVFGGVMIPNNSYTFVINTVGAMIYVDNDSTCTVGCGSSETPWPSIQQGIDALYVEDDLIMVKEGTYSGPINFHGKAVMVKSISGPEATIIQGGGSVVSFCCSGEANSVLDGFTITGGTGTDLSNIVGYITPFGIMVGGGIVIGKGSYPTILNCIIRDNSAFQGAGVYIASGCGANISHCTISNNSASTSCFIGSCSRGFGAGISVEAGSLNLTYCLLTGNVGSDDVNFVGYGSGAIFATGYLNITNNTITDNSGGIYIDIYEYPTNESTTSLAQPLKLESGVNGPNTSFYNYAESENTVGVTFNNIYDNSSNTAGYEIANQTTGNINATNNWWGTTDTAVIEAKIFDQNDDTTIGRINYLPIATNEIVFNLTLINLSNFKAIPSNDRVIINWVTESEIDNAGFNILRSESQSGPFAKINNSLISAKGSPTMGSSYEFIDTNVQNRKTYYYKLEDIDLNGKSTMHGRISATPRLIYGVGK